MTSHLVWGLLTMMSFNAVDIYFIGQLGATPLAAIGFTFPVVFIITGSAMGIGVGLSSVVSRAVGEGDRHRVAELATRGLMLAFVIVTVFAGLGLLMHDRLFAALGATPDLIALIRRYMVPWFLGVGLLVLPMVGNSALRASGDTFTPTLVMMLAAGLNVILDPLLIFGLGPFPRLELQGAAVATELSYTVTFVAAGWMLARRGLLLFEIPAWRALTATWKQILYIGLPAVGTNLLMPLANGIMTRVMAGHGPLAVAAFGVASRIESLAMVGSFALSTAMAAFAGQNIGARRYDRIAEAMRFNLRYNLLLGAAVWAVLFSFAHPIASLFTTDESIIRLVMPYLALVPLSYGAFGFMLQAASTFNAAGKPKYSVVLFTTRLFALTVPVAILASRVFGPTGVYIAMFAGNAATGALAFGLIHRALRHPGRML